MMDKSEFKYVYQIERKSTVEAVFGLCMCIEEMQEMLKKLNNISVDMIRDHETSTDDDTLGLDKSYLSKIRECLILSRSLPSLLYKLEKELDRLSYGNSEVYDGTSMSILRKL